MRPKRLSELVRDHILRRTKDMVLTDLPPKMFRDAELDLTPEQRATYEMAENEGVMQLNEMGDAITIQHVFELVLRLKQICNFDPATGASAKLERLTADLEEVAASGKKAIVFSQWVKCIDILAASAPPLRPARISRQMPSKQRDGVLKQFKEDKSKHVILMSYGAGSVGLNLQFCEYVFLFDRWWNPAVEDQAINRAHRIGAAGPVTVTRMLSLATIEERINEVLEHKRRAVRPDHRRELRPRLARPLAVRNLRPVQPANAQGRNSAGGMTGEDEASGRRKPPGTRQRPGTRQPRPRPSSALLLHPLCWNFASLFDFFPSPFSLMVAANAVAAWTSIFA